jgi:hypothetical protein
MNPNPSEFNGLGMHLGTLSRLSTAQSRSISPENPTGAPGQGGKAAQGMGAHLARDLGVGWKISPSAPLKGRSTLVLADIEGPAVISHMWIVTEHPTSWRTLILRMYWDNEATPSVEVPLGDFFCNGWGVYCQVNSLPVAAYPMGGFNCFWEMPFHKRALLTLENLADEEIPKGIYYQINYCVTDVPDDRACFHAQWRRSNPVAYMKPHLILDGVQGRGHYVGAYLAWGVNNDLWWSEGQVKIYLDGDTEWPTICGTGLEDYVGAAWTFEHPVGHYATYSGPFMGLPQALQAENSPLMRRRFGMYRWHVMDPIRFQQNIRVSVQSLGYLENHDPRYLPTQDDVASTAFWYQAEPHAPFPELPGVGDLRVCY